MRRGGPQLTCSRHRPPSPQLDPVATVSPVDRPSDHATGADSEVSDRRGLLGPGAALAQDRAGGPADPRRLALPGQARTLALAVDGSVPHRPPADARPPLHPRLRGRQDVSRQVDLLALGSHPLRGPGRVLPTPCHLRTPFRRCLVLSLRSSSQTLLVWAPARRAGAGEGDPRTVVARVGQGSSDISRERVLPRKFCSDPAHPCPRRSEWVSEPNAEPQRDLVRGVCGLVCAPTP